jgi:hypothetical protein
LYATIISTLAKQPLEKFWIVCKKLQNNAKTMACIIPVYWGFTSIFNIDMVRAIARLPEIPEMGSEYICYS